MKPPSKHSFWMLSLLMVPVLWADERDLASALGIESLDHVVVVKWGANWDESVDEVAVSDPEFLRALMQLLTETPAESGIFPLIPITLEKRSLILKSANELTELRFISNYLYSPVDGSTISGDLEFEDTETHRRYVEIGKKYSKLIDSALRNRKK